MQTQSTDWLEVLRAVGPYATAIIAILASSVAAWLAHRNWLKQFVIEKSYVLKQEQIRPLQMDEQLIQSLNQTADEFSQMSTEFETLRITSELYFGRKTEEALVAFGDTLVQASKPRLEYDEVRNKLNDHIKSAARRGESQSRLLGELVEKAQQGITPLFEEVQRTKLQVVRSMADFLKSAQQ